MSDTRVQEGFGLTRRELLTIAAALVTPGLARAATDGPETKLALPGPYRGRVVEIAHSGSVTGGKVQAGAVRAMMTRGMCELTGDKEETAAWKRFFAPSDKVGIKVSPVGHPLSISQPETVLEVIRGLNLAGVPNKNILVFNRYGDEFQAAGFDTILPPDIRWDSASPRYDNVQTGVDGYDPEVFVEMPRVMTGVDPTVAVNRRSHLCNIVSKQMDKVINLCTLKDHASAGLTMALKSLSHGCSNNVCRTHTDSANNWCDTFIPAVVGLRRMREKVVLHIGDGLIGTYDGGPGTWNPHFKTWEYGALFFATDPVAMDQIGWSILDKKRTAEGLPLLAETGAKGKNPGFEAFDHRQPEHVLLAAQAGLGEADLTKIVHRKISLGA